MGVDNNQSVPIIASVPFLYSWVNTKISLELGICQRVQICDVFRVTPTLFDGDYFWYTKHDASQSGIILLHFEWAFLI